MTGEWKRADAAAPSWDVRRVISSVVLVAVSLAVTALGAGGCDDESTPSAATAAQAPAMRTVQMRIGDKTFTLEVAETPFRLRYGLMNRPSLAEDRGMLFVWDDEQVRGFYNKNVNFPLDLIFINSAGEVVSIRHMEAQDPTSVFSERPVRYTVELNKGTAERVGLKVGDVVEIPSEARKKK
jgi:uncharacterized membrane protein (UPF0127 family)